MRDWKYIRTLILIYRIILGLLTWTTLILMFVNSAIKQTDALSGFISGLSTYRYYTMQTNLFAALWLTLAIIFHGNPKKLNKIKGVLKGAITIYISITFIVYAIMLRSLYNPTAILDKFTNIITHYAIPLAFLIDSLFTEKTIKYKWLNLVFWVIYPVLYLLFAITHGKLTGDYLYPFLDVNELGVGYFILVVVILLIGFLALGSLLILINLLWNKRLSTIKESTQSDPIKIIEENK